VHDLTSPEREVVSDEEMPMRGLCVSRESSEERVAPEGAEAVGHWAASRQQGWVAERLCSHRMLEEAPAVSFGLPCCELAVVISY
jgi:hypothetical protein